MLPPSVITLALLLGCMTSVQGLKCNEGFNMTFGGIPFYHWVERACADDSKCFSQELKQKAEYGVEVVMRYGSCLSAAYASYLDCNKLFGPDSTFDPALLLDMVPDIERQIKDLVTDFMSDGVGQLKILFSNGQGTSEFIDGIFKFCQNIGLNPEKAESLKDPFAKLLIAAIDQNITEQTTMDLLNAIGSLDTANTDYTNSIYKFLGNFMSSEQVEQFKADVVLKPIIERIPGLGRSMLPAAWSPALWYDITFELLAELDTNNLKKTATDMVATIRETYTIPDDIKEYVDPFFNRFPDLVDKLTMGKFEYVGNWSLELLKDISEENVATTAFSDAMINFIEKMVKTNLQYEFRATIQWVPGLFYKFFPGDKAEIEKVYTKMAAGFNSFNFTDLNQTAQSTKLSEIVIRLVEQSFGQMPGTVERALIINFSRMFYNLLDDYSSYVEKFFQILDDALATWPTINAGKTIRDLIVRMNQTVPAEIDPLLTHLQTVVAPAMTIGTPDHNATALDESFTVMINAYKKAFPNSPFPGLVEEFIALVKERTEVDSLEKHNDNMMKFQDWGVDLEFAMFNSVDHDTNELTQMLIEAFPSYEIYIKLMKSLKAEDIKDLMKEIVAWTAKGPYTTKGFVDAIKPTVKKITASVSGVLGDIRKLVQPESCKYGSCDTDLCNLHSYIAARQAVTKAPAVVVPPSSGEKMTANVLVNIVSLWVAHKFFIG